MAEITLLRNKKSIGLLMLDAMLSESHSYQSQVTMYPVEDGSNISDNVLNEPFELSIEGVITENHLDGLISGGVSDAYKSLLKMRDDKEPVTIVSSLDVHKNMLIKSIDIPRDKQKSLTNLYFSMSLVQLKIVKNKFTVLVNNTIKKRVQPKKEKSTLPMFTGGGGTVANKIIGE
jgi:hypothetical protein